MKKSHLFAALFLSLVLTVPFASYAQVATPASTDSAYQLDLKIQILKLQIQILELELQLEQAGGTPVDTGPVSTTTPVTSTVSNSGSAPAVSAPAAPAAPTLPSLEVYTLTNEKQKDSSDVYVLSNQAIDLNNISVDGVVTPFTASFDQTSAPNTNCVNSGADRKCGTQVYRLVPSQPLASGSHAITFVGVNGGTYTGSISI